MKSPPPSDGLLRYLPSSCHRGYTLFCGGDPGAAYLIDMEGRICRRWSHPRGIQYAILLESGHLLCRANSSPEVQGVRGLNGQTPCVFELDPEARVSWEFEDPWLHHDFERLPDGNTLIVQWRWMSEEQSARVRGGAHGPEDRPEMLGDVVIEVDPAGSVVREWLSWEHLDPEIDVICPIDHRLEWTHCNSIYTTPEGEWLVSLRRIDTVAAIDPESGKIDWRFGRGVLAHQHDAKVLPNGRLLVFDNGAHRQGVEYSRVLEVDRASGEIAWEYRADPPFGFYSFMGGSAERLANQNTLICHSSGGRLFEVTPDRQIVWEYVNPFYANNPRLGGRHNITFRAHRYGPDHPALERLDLDPARYANLNQLYA